MHKYVVHFLDCGLPDVTIMADSFDVNQHGNVVFFEKRKEPGSTMTWSHTTHVFQERVNVKEVQDHPVSSDPPTGYIIASQPSRCEEPVKIEFFTHKKLTPQQIDYVLRCTADIINNL